MDESEVSLSMNIVQIGCAYFLYNFQIMCKHVSVYQKQTIFHMFWIKLYFQKPKLFTCDKCWVVKKSKAQIDKHRAAHEWGILYCKVCKKSYNDKTHLVEHEDTHTKEHRKTCKETLEGSQVCHHTYLVQGSIRTHMRNAHNKPLMTRNYHTKDGKNLPMKPYKSTKTTQPKKTPQQLTLLAMLKFTFLHHMIV